MNPTQHDRYGLFASLHAMSTPLVLVNIWDVGSARAAEQGGAQALATGSWAVAAAHGFTDGQNLPVALALDNVRRVTAATDLPVTVDVEQGYGDTPEEAAATVEAFAEAGAVGINIEDALTETTRRSADDNAARLQAVRDQVGRNVWVNARTDVFFQTDPARHAEAIGEAVERSNVYRDAGADSLFVPGLTAPALIQELVAASSLPINVMATAGSDVAAVRTLGVARVSMGPGPYLAAMETVTELVRKYGVGPG